jgi:hypothetical protein
MPHLLKKRNFWNKKKLKKKTFSFFTETIKKFKCLTLIKKINSVKVFELEDF